jgi:hypothetical protein
MKFSVALIACLVALSNGLTNAQTSRVSITGDRPAGEATIRGHAIYDDTEKPARHVGVALINTTHVSESQRIAVTDNKGDFIFKNVATGSYRVAADFGGRTNGFPAGEIDRSEGFEVSVDGSSSIDVKIRAIRGASITGRVTYPDGEPVMGAQVNVYRKLRNQWTHAAVVAAGTETDDRGIFRIYPLHAGEYAISVTEQSMVIQEREGTTIQTVESNSINPYFYQDSADLKDATIIQVDGGRETNNINFTLIERATYEIAGSIMTNEKPLPGIYLRLNAHDDGLGGPTLMRPWGLATQSDKDGHWFFKGVPDGTYDIDLDPMWSGNGSQRSFGRFVAQRKVVTVAGSDISGIMINLTEGGRISGRILCESGKPLPRELIVITELVSVTNPYRSSSSVQVDATGNFTLTGVPPGENILTVSCGRDCFAKSITLKGSDLLRQPIKVESGLEVTGVVVAISSEVGTLTGRVVSGKDKKPLSGTFLGLMPTDETRWLGRSFGDIAAMTDANGAFKVSGPPGDYFLVTVTNPKIIASPEALKDLARKSMRVSLKTSTPNEVEVIVP